MKILKMSILCAVVFSSTAALAQFDGGFEDMWFVWNMLISRPIIAENPLNIIASKGKETSFSLYNNILNIHNFNGIKTFFQVTGDMEHLSRNSDLITVKSSTPEWNYALTAKLCVETPKEPILPYFPTIIVPKIKDPEILISDPKAPDDVWMPIIWDIEIEDEE